MSAGPVAAPAARPRAGLPARPWRVLVFPGGTEIGLEVRAALRDRREVELWSAGVDAPGHAPFAFARHEALPSVTEPGWRDALAALVARRGIDVVYPAHDMVIAALAEEGEAVGAPVVSSPAATCLTCRSKSRTYRALAGAVPVPRVYAGPDEVTRWPVFVKPDAGQGSQGARLARDPHELRRAIADGSGLIMDHLPGDEHTVDCFSDRERGLLHVAPRRRVTTRAGIATISRPVEDPELIAYAGRIADRLELHGAWFFQTRRDADGVHRLLEVAPRIAGTSALQRAVGVNLPLLSLYERMGVPVDVAPLPLRAEIGRALVNRFRLDLDYPAVYVDLDDTLIVRGRVNGRLVGWLHQCADDGRRLVLLTRHAGDPLVTLARHRLAGLFDEVVRVAEGEEKADRVREPGAILVDDSFRERRAAAERGVLAFDPSAVEALWDDRV